MGKLIYSAITSLDGYVAGADGRFDWAAPDDEVHAFVNDLVRPVGAYLYGRRMYDVMRVWETMGLLPEESPATADFAAIWRAAHKVVYSSSLDEVSSSRTRIARCFSPEAARRMTDLAERDVSIGGPHLAAQALRSGVVDEVQLFLNPVVVGGGKPALPDDVRLDLKLLDERRFGNGVVYLNYRLGA